MNRIANRIAFTMALAFTGAVAVPARAARRGVALCDMHEVFKAFGRDGLNAYMADAAHPNAKGHAVMAKAIADLLVPAR